MTVRRVDDVTPRLRRLVLGGDELAGMVIDEPAASVRLLLPAADGSLELPTWTGNQFETAAGDRAPIRTFTPRVFDAEARELTIDIVVHAGGAASDWAAAAEVGDQVAVSGPGRGYEIDGDARAYLLAGDETAIPAMAQLLEVLPHDVAVTVVVEIADPAARHDLPAHPRSDVVWRELGPDAEPGDELLAAVRAMDDLPPAVWVAGEAAGVQRVRKYLFDERGLSRRAATVRGYWKLGRSAT